MSTLPYEDHDPGGRTAVPAALGLFLLAAGGWLLTTARPWHKPGGPLVLALDWTGSAVLLVSGLTLLVRGIRAVHGGDRPSP